MLRFLCKKCGQRLKVGDGDVGRKIRCPGCNYGTAVPPIKLSAKAYHFEYSVCDSVGAAGASTNSSSGQSPAQGVPVPNSDETVLGITSPVKPAAPPATPAAPVQMVKPVPDAPRSTGQVSAQVSAPVSDAVNEPDLKPGQTPADYVPASALPLRPGARLAPAPANPARYQAALAKSRARTASLRLRPTARPAAAPAPLSAPEPEPQIVLESLPEPAPTPVKQAKPAVTPAVQPQARVVAVPPVQTDSPITPPLAAPIKPPLAAPISAPSAPMSAPVKPAASQLRPGARLAPSPADPGRYKSAIAASKEKTRRLQAISEAGPLADTQVVSQDEVADELADISNQASMEDIVQATAQVSAHEPLDEALQSPAGQSAEVVGENLEVFDAESETLTQEDAAEEPVAADEQSIQSPVEASAEAADEAAVAAAPEQSGDKPVEPIAPDDDEPVVRERPESPVRIDRPEAPVMVRRTPSPMPAPRSGAPRPMINRQPDLSAPMRNDNILAAGRSLDPAAKALDSLAKNRGRDVPAPAAAPANDFSDGFPAPTDSGAFDPAEALRQLADAVSGQSGAEPVQSVPVHDFSEDVSAAQSPLPILELDDDEPEREGRLAPSPADPARYRAAIAASKNKPG